MNPTKTITRWENKITPHKKQEKQNKVTLKLQNHERKSKIYLKITYLNKNGGEKIILMGDFVSKSDLTPLLFGGSRRIKTK